MGWMKQGYKGWPTGLQFDACGSQSSELFTVYFFIVKHARIKTIHDNYAIQINKAETLF